MPANRVSFYVVSPRLSDLSEKQQSFTPFCDKGIFKDNFPLQKQEIKALETPPVQDR